MLTDIKDRVMDELKDALFYMEKAVENKGTKQGMRDYQDAIDELRHANDQLDNFRETPKPKTMTDAEYSAMMKEILDGYANSMIKFEGMKRLYWNK